LANGFLDAAWETTPDFSVQESLITRCKEGSYRSLYGKHVDDIKLVISDMNMPIMDGAAMIPSNSCF